MQKMLIVALLGLSIMSQVYAACDDTPYNAPEDLRPTCEKEVPVSPPATPPTPQKTPAQQQAKVQGDAKPSEKSDITNPSPSDNKPPAVK